MILSIYERTFQHLNVIRLADRAISNGISVIGTEPHERIFIQKSWMRNELGQLRFEIIAMFKFKK